MTGGSYKTSCIYYLISKYIPNKSFIFVTRFLPISVMELVESGFISYWSKSVLSLAHEN